VQKLTGLCIYCKHQGVKATVQYAYKRYTEHGTNVPVEAKWGNIFNWMLKFKKKTPLLIVIATDLERVTTADGNSIGSRNLRRCASACDVTANAGLSSAAMRIAWSSERLNPSTNTGTSGARGRISVSFVGERPPPPLLPLQLLVTSNQRTRRRQSKPHYGANQRR